jgi:hypothetical protein
LVYGEVQKGMKEEEESLWNGEDTDAQTQNVIGGSYGAEKPGKSNCCL